MFRTLNFPTKVFIAFAAVYLIWGSTYLAIRFTIETIPPLLSGGLRFFLAGAILYFYRLSKGDPAPSKVHWKSAFIIGAFLLLGGNGSVVLAQRFIPSGLTSIFIAMTPLWMVLLQWLWQKDKRPSNGVFLGIAIGFLGVWLLMSPDLVHFNARHVHLGGALTLIFASLSWAIGSVYSRKVSWPSSPLLATGMQMMAGGVLLILAGLLRGELTDFYWLNFSFKSILAFLYLLFVGSLVGFTAYIWLLKNVGVAKTSTYAFVNPIVAVFLGWIFAGEILTMQTALAALCIVTAVIIITVYQNKAASVQP